MNSPLQATNTKNEVLVTPTPFVQKAIEDTPMYGLTGAAFSIVAGILWLRRRTSRDGLEIAKDKSEGGVIKTLEHQLSKAIEERDKALATASEAWRVRTENAQKIATLEQQVKHLEENKMTTSERVQSLEKQLHQLQSLVARIAPQEMANIFAGVEVKP